MDALEPPRFILLSKVARTLRDRDMLAGGVRVLVAVSGGLDSLCLLDILVSLSADLHLELGVFHFDHRLRPDSGEDAAFVESVAVHYGLPFFGRSGDVAALTREQRLSPEEGARKARYEALDMVAKEWEADRVALGHTADDRVETFLLRLLAGAGTRGLSSIPPTRGIYFRPLIDTWRRELEGVWAPSLPFTPRQDSTNLDEDIPRNRIRHRLLPLLEREYNPAVREALLREADLLAEDQARLEEMTLERAPLFLQREGDDISLDCAALEAMGQAERRRAVQAALELAGIEPGFRHVEDIIAKVLGGGSGAGLDMPGGWRAERAYERLHVAKQLPVSATGEQLLVCGEGEHRAPGLGLALILRYLPEVPLKPRTPDAWHALLDADLLSFPLRLRALREGDRFRPLGAPGSQKVQDFLVNAKVRRRDRLTVAVLESGDSVTWLVGYRIDDRFKVTRETRRVLSLEARPLAG